MTTSPFLGLRLPELEDYYSLDGHWNYNSLLLDEFLANVNAAIVQLGETTAGKQDALTTAQLAAANSGVTAAKIAQYDAALAELIDNGPKNRLQMTHAAGSSTKNGVTCTWDPDAGTMTLTGTHAAGAESCIFEFYAGNASDQRVLPAGTYHLSGVPAGGSTSTYRAALTSITGAVDTGSGADFTLTEPKYAAYRILISGACDFTGGVVFKPMICAKSVWDVSQKFVPFAPTNAELFAMIQGGTT